MGFIPSLLGIGGGQGRGGDFQAQGVNQDQLNQAASGVNSANQQQQAFVNALQGQNGIGNQSSVFGQQQGLANQLMDQTQGGGPNPAMAQLANTTGQNIQNQAALMAGQRGVNSNPGLAARQIGQMGSQQQQAAVGQAAALRAQQQLAAQQQLQQQQAQMAGLASQQVGQQQQGLGQLGQQSLAGQQQLFGMQQNQNNANAGIAGVNAKGQQDILGGVLKAAGSAIGMSHGGQVQYMAGGGTAEDANSQPASMLGKFGQGLANSMQFGSQGPNDASQQSQLSKGMNSFGGSIGSKLHGLFGGAGGADAGAAGASAGLGGMAPMEAMPMSTGGPVPGQPMVGGDDPKNDTVPALLSPGEVVIPRTKVGDSEKTAKFLNALLGMNLKAGKGSK